MAQEVGEWAVADGVDIRVVGGVDSVRFKPTELPDKFVTGERRVPSGLQWPCYLSMATTSPDCATHSVLVPTAGTAWELGYFNQGRLGSGGMVAIRFELAAWQRSPGTGALDRCLEDHARFMSLSRITIMDMVVCGGGLELAPSEELSNEFHRAPGKRRCLFDVGYCRHLPSASWFSERTRSSKSLLCLPLALVLAIRQGKHWIWSDLGTWIAMKHGAILFSAPALSFRCWSSLFILNRYINTLVPVFLPSLFVKLSDIIFGLIIIVLLLPWFIC